MCHLPPRIEVGEKEAGSRRPDKNGNTKMWLKRTYLTIVASKLNTTRGLVNLVCYLTKHGTWCTLDT
jgi:hypothetical protein